MLAFIERGLGAQARVAVVAPTERLELLASHLGGRADRADFVDMTTIGRNPVGLIPAYRRLAERHRGRRLFVVNDPLWPSRRAEEIEEVLVHEELLNAAFAETGMCLLCPFDAGELDAGLIAELKRIHPLGAEGEACAPSADYSAHTPIESLQRPLGRIPAPGERMPFSLAELGDLRARVARAAADAGLDPERRSDIVLAVHELAANSIRHAGGSGELELWTTPGRVSAEVRDRGKIDDPLVGRIDPAGQREGGLGLWLVGQLCDLLQIRSGEQGTTVRIHMHRGPAGNGTGADPPVNPAVAPA